MSVIRASKVITLDSKVMKKISNIISYFNILDSRPIPAIDENRGDVPSDYSE